MNQLLADASFSIGGAGIQPDVNAKVATNQLENIISTTIGALTLIAIIFFTLQLIFAGYSFMSAQGDKSKVEAARKRLTDGILGITIVVVAYGVGALIASLTGLGTNIFDLNNMVSLLKFQ
jgi:hypothetical protein